MSRLVSSAAGPDAILDQVHERVIALVPMGELVIGLGRAAPAENLPLAGEHRVRGGCRTRRIRPPREDSGQDHVERGEHVVEGVLGGNGRFARCRCHADLPETARQTRLTPLGLPARLPPTRCERVGSGPQGAVSAPGAVPRRYRSLSRRGRPRGGRYSPSRRCSFRRVTRKAGRSWVVRGDSTRGSPQAQATLGPAPGVGQPVCTGTVGLSLLRFASHLTASLAHRMLKAQRPRGEP